MDSLKNGKESAALLSAVADRWLAWKKNSLKASSIARYQSILSLHLLPAFGSRPITGISRQDALFFIQSLQTGEGPEKPRLSPSSAAVVLAVLKNILEYEGQHGLTVADLRGICISALPCRRLSPHMLSTKDRCSRI